MSTTYTTAASARPAAPNAQYLDEQQGERVDRAATSATVEDFDSLIVSHFAGQRGWYCLGYIDGDPNLENLKQEWYFFPRQRHDIAERYTQLAERGFNLYWAACLFSARKRNYKNALPSPWLWQDDAPADVTCTALIQTSAHKAQAWLLLDRPISADERKRLQTAWRDQTGADACSADAVHMGRIPGGYNCKRHAKHLVTVVRQSDLILSADHCLAKYPPIPEKPSRAGEITDLAWPKVEAHLTNVDHLLASARAKTIKPSTQTGRILAGEMLTFVVKRGNDDSRSMNGYVLGNGLYMRGFMDDEIAAVMFLHYRKWGVERDKGTAWCKDDITRAIARMHAEKPDAYQTPTRYKQATAPAPIVETPAASRARSDRPRTLDDVMLLHRYQQQPELCELSRKPRAAALGVSTATLDRLEDKLEARQQIRIDTAGRGMPGRVVLLIAGGVINIAAPGVLSAAQTQIADSSLLTEQNDNHNPQCIGGTHTPLNSLLPPAPPALPEVEPPPLADAIHWAIVAMERDAVWNTATGEIRRGRANPDRIRGWIAEHYPTLETVELEALYPQVRKQVQADRVARKNRDFWQAQRANVQALNDEQLIAALWGAASRMQAAERKRAGSPWAKRCKALFAIHDDERRRRGLAAGDAPPPAKDRASRKAAKVRMEKLGPIVNGAPVQPAEGSVPAQIGFASIGERASEEDLLWMSPSAPQRQKRTSRRATPARAEVERVTFGGVSAAGVFPPTQAPAGASIPDVSSLIGRLKAAREAGSVVV